MAVTRLHLPITYHALAPVRILRGCYPHGDKCGVTSSSFYLHGVGLKNPKHV